MKSETERIVITGIGTVSPYGVGTERFLEGIRQGQRAIRPIEDFDVKDCQCQVGARVPKIDVTAHGGTPQLRRAPRATQYAIAATDEALKQAGYDPSTWSAEKVSVFLGTYRAMTEVGEEIWRKLIETEPRFVPALLFQETVTNAVASAISIRWGLRGTNYAISSGNTGGFQVLYLAAQAVRAGRADAVIAGTFDLFTAANQHDMDDLGMLSRSNVSRPFDRERDGFVMGEGAAVVVLETLARAQQRGATIVAELSGIELSHDGHAFASHDAEGRGLAAAMRHALSSSGKAAEEIDYLGAAANSTWTLDRAESVAIRTVFGTHASRLPVSSIKSMTGEAMAASDLFNIIVCADAIAKNTLPLQIGTDQPDCELNLVRSGKPEKPIRTALANSYSFFGGNAAAAVLQACG